MSKINPTRSHAIIFSKKDVDFQLVDNIVVNNEIIPQVNKVRNLGLIFDSSLSWANEVSSICQRIYYGLHRLYKFRSMTPIETGVRLVNTTRCYPLFLINVL
jgi:hypothetical protein